MEKMSPKKLQGLIVTALILLCVAIGVGILTFISKNKNITEVLIATKPTGNVASVEENRTAITPDKSTVTEVVSTIIESDTESEHTSKPNNIQLTEVSEKSQPPEKPKTALTTEKPHEKPKDKDLTNPNKKPQATVKPVEPDKQKDKTPKGGELNGKGDTYVPGFGWVKDGGANIGERSDSDGDWNKQIGDMN